MFKRFVPLIMMVFALLFAGQPLYAQHRGQQGRGREGQGRAEPRQAPQRGGQRADPRDDSRHAQPRQPHDGEMHGYAVPRRQPLPRPREGFGAYGRLQYRGHIFFWRPYPVIWITPNTCVPGYWDWDQWYGGWVWVQGYCNVPGFRPYAGFYFWYDAARP